MQVTDEVVWTAFDFFAAAILFGAVCGGIELTARAGRGPAYVAAGALALFGGLLIVWANLAVGIIGNEENPLNQMFFGVVGIGLVLAVVSRLRPKGMARAMAATAAAQGVAAVAAVGLTGEPGAIYAAVMAAPFLVSSWLYHLSARPSS
jgi:stage V sporulation protein SpoVS